MNDEFEKPFGRPSGWGPELGKGKNVGHHAPEKIHSLLREAKVKRLLSRMALDPEFKARILVMVDEVDKV
jgi:hypothetical protein